MYLLNNNDRHTVTADTELRMLCVFNPPVVGTETHDENGVYPLVTVGT
jgi:L-ectoine synthase